MNATVLLDGGAGAAGGAAEPSHVPDAGDAADARAGLTAGAPSRSLEEELRALIHAETFACPVCGAQVRPDEDGRIACPDCGSALEAPPLSEGQLSLM